MFTINNILKQFKYKNCQGNNDIVINGIQTLDDKNENKILFVKNFDLKLVDKINKFNNCLIILLCEYKEYINNHNNFYIFESNPRYEFARCTQLYISHFENSCKLINKGQYVIGEDSIIGEDTKVEPFVYIGNNVTIGKRCVIMSGARIKNNVTIGDDCIIRENAVIGGFGFGMEKDECGNNFRLPHIGGVILGNNVEIGALTTVCSGTIKPTIVNDYTKVDDHVHIAHNCIIGKNCIITACAEVSGSVIIGDNTWLAPNTSIKNGLIIGQNVTLGMGSVVCKNIDDNMIVVGPMADSLENAKRINLIKNKLLQDNEKNNE